MTDILALWGSPLGSPPWARIPPPRYGKGCHNQGSVPFAHLNPVNPRKNMGAFFFRKATKKCPEKFLLKKGSISMHSKTNKIDL